MAYACQSFDMLSSFFGQRDEARMLFRAARQPETLGRLDELSIAWPSGAVQTFRELAADQELNFVEGSPRVTVVPR